MKKFLSHIGFGLLAILIVLAALCFVVGTFAFVFDVFIKGQAPNTIEGLSFIWFCLIVFIIGVEIDIEE